jgi:glycosyltransferase involved in cell wall biosynthesis
MMKKVCILTSAHSPYDDRIYEREAVSLSRAGYYVTIIAPWDRSELTPERIQIIAVKKPASRVGRFMMNGKDIFIAALSQKANIYHFHDPDLLPWMVGISAIGKRVIYDVHEYNSKSILTKAWLPASLRRTTAKGIEWLEGWASSKFAGVITVNPHMANLFLPYTANVESIANYPLPWFVEGCARSGEPRVDRIIYVGGLNKERGYELIFEAMKLVRQRHLHAECFVIGQIDYSEIDPKYPKFEQNGNSVDGVTWGGILKLDHVPSSLLKARIGWIPWQWTPNNDQGTPVKLFEYMAAGQPVVASKLGFIAEIIEQTGCGLLVPPSNPKAHADAICYLLDNPVVAAEMGERGRKAVHDRYNWTHEEKKLLAFYEKIFSG